MNLKEIHIYYLYAYEIKEVNTNGGKRFQYEMFASPEIVCNLTVLPNADKKGALG